MKKKIISGTPSNGRMLRLLLVISIINLLGIAGLFIYQRITTPKTGYVDLGKVYESFDMTAEKEKQLNAMQMDFNNTLDSLKLIIASLENQGVSSADEELKRTIERRKLTYLQLEETMQASLDKAKAEADEQIWAQINKYTSEFGAANDYDYIYGGNGSGSMMYARPKNDVSGQVIAFINNKYAGE